MKGRRPTATQRGYGMVHQTLRMRFAPKVEAGPVICARCQKQILPGEPWDLGHIDGSTTEYAGPEHRRCNRATAAPTRRTERSWRDRQAPRPLAFPGRKAGLAGLGRRLLDPRRMAGPARAGAEAPKGAGAMSIERPAPTLLSELHGGQDALPEELARMALEGRA